MNAGGAGRLVLSLTALAALIASGVTGVVTFRPGGRPAGDSGQAHMLGVAVAAAPGHAKATPAAAIAGPRTRPRAATTGHRQAPPSAPPSPRPAGRPASRTASRPDVSRADVSRADVTLPHSPELLHLLAGPLSGTGRPGNVLVPRAGGPVSEAPDAPAASAGPNAAAASAAGSLPEGVDVASYQYPSGAAINWSQVATAGYTFAAVKASEGNYYTNSYYASDLAGAQAAGVYVAPYHFAIPNVSDGTSQADYAVSKASYTAGPLTLPLMADLEYDPYASSDGTNNCYGLTAAQMVSWIQAFATEVKAKTGQLPIIYTTAGWWDTCTGSSTAFTADPLWIADYSASGPAMPPGWAHWTFWQYTSGGTVPGITNTPPGGTDLDYFNGNPGNQATVSGSTVSLQMSSLAALTGQGVTYSATGLPPGLSISPAGLISGTVSAGWGSSYTVTVTATGASGITSPVSFTWAVTAPFNPGGAMK